MLLNALPKSYEHLKDAMLFGRENSISFEEVQSSLKAKEFQKNNAKFVDLTTESLNVSANEKCHPKKKSAKELPLVQEAMAPQERLLCFQEEASRGESRTSCCRLNQLVEVAEVLTVAEGRIHSSWIMDSGCSFHVTSNADWLVDMGDAEGTVSLGNDHICYVKAVGSVRFHMDDGSVKILSDVRYILEIKRNLILLGLLERKEFSFT